MGDSFRKGSIVRIKLYNFLTYTEQEIFPGPRLNMILGPNGTGKSSIICAICLGLAGKTDSLGRASKIADYIKKGEEDGYVEIELHQPDEKNLVIKRKINHDSKSIWTINDKKKSEKEVVATVKKLNIQVDNLCVFLAQERVVQFAKLKPLELLEETQKAASMQLYQIQQKLVSLLKDFKQQRQSVNNQKERTDVLAKQQAELKGEVDRYKHREELLEKVDLLKKKRPWTVYAAEKAEVKKNEANLHKMEEQLQEEDKKAEPTKKEIAELTRTIGVFTDKEKKLKTQFSEKDNQRQKLGNELDDYEGKVDKVHEDIQELKQKFDEREERKNRLKTEILKSEKELKLLRPMDRIKEEETQLGEELKAARLELNAFDRHVLSLKNDEKKAEAVAAHHQKQFGELQDSHQRRLDNIFERNPKGRDIYHLVNKLRGENKFQKEVYGPVIAEVETKEKLHQAYFEKQIGWMTRFAYVTQTKQDWELLGDVLKANKLKAQIGAVTSAPSRSVGDPQEKKRLQDLGLEGYLDEVIECPPAVRAFLQGYGLEKAGFTTKELSTKTYDQMVKQSGGSRQGLSTLFTPSRHITVRGSDYGDHVSVSYESIPPAQHFCPLDKTQEDELRKAIYKAQEEVKKARQKTEEKEKEGILYKQNVDKINSKKAALKSEIVKLVSAQRKVQSLKEQFEQESGEFNFDHEMQKLRDEITGMNNYRCKKLEQLKITIKEWTEVSLLRDANLLNLADGKDKMEIKKRELEEKQRGSEVLRNKVKKYKVFMVNAKNKLKATKAAAEKASPLNQFKHRFQEEWMPNDFEAIDLKIAEFNAQIDASVADSDILQRYTERQRELEEMESELQRSTDTLQEAESEIKTLSDQWKPKLEEIVSVINEQFSFYYRDFGCEGEVKLNCGTEDIEKYTLEIWVKYREAAQLKLLSGYSQSGGERSVATMLFLLCLQKVTDCPFRVVDEINQGMDPRNERMIFNQIVRSSETQDTPQYFLVTPKLLPGLKYTPAVTVLFVYNGPWLQNRLSWEPKQFIEAMKQRKRKSMSQ